jgi:hypothetical protein
MLEAESDAYANTVLAPAVSGGFWALRPNQSVLRRYSADGEALQSVSVALDYFEPWEADGPIPYDAPPPPWHVGVIDLGNDLIVILTAVPGTEWSPVPSDRTFRPSERDPDRLFDTFAALVDLRTGQAIASTRVPEYLHVAGGAPDLLYTVRQDSVGHVITRILRVRARRPD